MREPLAWAGLAVTLGAWAWPWWMPDLGESLAGAWFLAALAMVVPTARATRACLLGGAFLLGGAACAARPPPPELGPLEAVVGTVVASAGRTRIVDTDHGRLALEFAGEDPLEGQRIAALAEPPRAGVALPGSPGRPRDHDRWGAAPRFARRWVRIDRPPEREGLRRFALARHGGFLRAMVDGDRAEVPEEVDRLLRATGTSHVLSISGLHVGIVGGLAYALALVLTRPLAFLRWPWLLRAVPALLALGAAFAYAALVGWPVSAKRAAWMGGAAMATAATGRRPRPWTLFGIATTLVVLTEPGQVAAPAFQLSFGAVAGMLLVTPRLMRWVPPDVALPVRWTAGMLATTAGATAGTLPVSAWLFQQLAPAAPLANFLAVPLMGTIAVPASIAAAIVPGAPGLFSLAAADAAVDLALRGLALVEVDPWAPAVGPLGAIGLCASLLLRRRLLVALAAALAILGFRAQGPPRFSATWLAVGQGDAALLEWPDRYSILVDGGPPSREVLHWLRRRRIRRIDAVVLTHPHPDHLGGILPVLEELAVGEWWVPRPPRKGEDDYLRAWRTAWARGVPVRFGRAGDTVGGRARILHPTAGFTGPRRSAENDESVVLESRFGQRSFLLAGDVERAGEEALLPALSRVDVVKVPHHGSSTSSSRGFVTATRPRLALISCGAGNRYGHPRSDALSRWFGTAVLRTDRDGTIEISTDGADLRVRAWTPEAGWRLLERQPQRPIGGGVPP